MYKCRVDYHLEQTSFQLVNLNVIVPPQKPTIYYRYSFIVGVLICYHLFQHDFLFNLGLHKWHNESNEFITFATVANANVTAVIMLYFFQHSLLSLILLLPQVYASKRVLHHY